MKNKILALFLAIIMIFSILPTAAFAVEKPEGAEWLVDEGDNHVWYQLTDANTDLTNDTLTIGGTGAMPDFATNDGAPWNSNKGNITTLVIQSGVTGIGEYAFSGFSNLVSVTVPSSVKSIGSFAFNSCRKLAALYIDSIESWCGISFAGPTSNPFSATDTEVPNLYVSNTLTTKPEIPVTVSSIPANAFYNWRNIIDLTIHSSVKSVGANAFYGCKNLTALHIDSVKDWCNISFDGANSAPFYSLNTGVTANLYINNVLTTELEIPVTVSSIPAYAFYKWRNLTSVSMGNGVSSIGKSAFEYCQNLAIVKIPASVLSVEKDAFKDCSKIKTLYIDSIESWCNVAFASDRANPFFASSTSKEKKLYVNNVLTTDLVIPSTITSIPAYAFACWMPLTSVKIPSSVKSIGAGAFSNCQNLASLYIDSIESWCAIKFDNTASNPLNVTNSILTKKLYVNGVLTTSLVIPGTVNTISVYALRPFSNITSFKFENGVTDIEAQAFLYCSGLTEVTLPSSVSNIGGDAFNNCTNLATVTVKATTPPTITSYSFKFDKISKILVPAGAKDDYTAADYWSTAADKIKEAYMVDVAPTEYGTVSVSKDCFPIDTYTVANGTVTVNVTPKAGYTLKSLKYNDGTDRDIKNTKSFTMPLANVAVTAVFEEASAALLLNNALGGETVAANEYFTVDDTTVSGTRIIKLLKDITFEESDVRLVVPTGKKIILDLNGFTLDRGLKDETSAVDKGNVFTVNGKLTVQDNSVSKTGKITGGTSAYGAAIISNGETVLESGSITGCKALSEDYDTANSKFGRGGAIYVPSNGKFTMTGGEIKNCSATVAGGAIFNCGTVTITGGKITGCSVSGLDDGSGTVKAKGGAVYNFATSNFTMTGGEISGNTLGKVEDMRGAGVYSASGANITLGGTAKITGNLNGAGKANNLYLYEGNTVNISTETPPTAMNIGLNTKATPTEGSPVKIADAENDYRSFFNADNSEYDIIYENNGIYISVKTAKPCIYQQKICTPVSGETYQLKFGCKDAGYYRFEKVDSGYLIIKSAKPGSLGAIQYPYLAMKDGKITYTDKDNATVWTYKNGAFSVSISETVTTKGSWFLFFYIPGTTKTTTKTYYLNTVGEGNNLSLIFTSADLYEEVTGEHEFGCLIDCKDGTHKRICKNCGEEEIGDCIYDNDTHKCVCGAFDPDWQYLDVTATYDSKTTKQFVGFLFFGTFKDVTTYTAKVNVEASGLKVKKIEVSATEKGCWTLGSTFTSSTEIEKFFVRVTTTNGEKQLFMVRDGIAYPAN